MATAVRVADRLAESYARAVEALKAAHAPQDTPGGRLCWSGRLQRAIKLHNEATVAGDKEKAAQIRKGIDVLNEAANEALSKANDAAATYTATAIAMGRTPAELPVIVCECEGCALKNAQAEFFAAEFELRKAVFDLLKPKDMGDALPWLCQLMDSGKDTAPALGAICAAMRRYSAAATAYGRRINWHEIYR